MITLIIIGIIGFIIYNSVKGNSDIKNVQKHGGLRNKYKILIESILRRSPYYRIRELNANNIEISDHLGMKWKFIEIDKKIKVMWQWNRPNGNCHRLQWYFEEFSNQDAAYEIINKDLKIQNLIDDGMTKEQANDMYIIKNTEDNDEVERLIEKFKNKYPEWWAKMMD